MTYRPYVTIKPYTWKDGSGPGTFGIALMQGRTVRAHLTPDEARSLADKLHDLTDAAGNPESELPTTPAENE